MLVGYLRISGKSTCDRTQDPRVRPMFSLFYGLWKYVFTKDEFRVLILGVDKAGKTVVALRLYFPF